MGTDIHSFVEKKVNGKWEPVQGIHAYYYDYIELAENAKLKGDMNGYERCMSYSERFKSTYYNWATPYRDYDLFGLLANVRNGYGFAGIDTGDGFIPISDLKGIPEDASDMVKEEYGDGWGWHSPSYVSLKELLEYNWDRKTKKRCEDEEWEVSYRECFDYFLNDIIPKLEEIAEGCPENVRIVFWFDS